MLHGYMSHLYSSRIFTWDSAISQHLEASSILQLQMCHIELLDAIFEGTIHLQVTIDLEMHTDQNVTLVIGLGPCAQDKCTNVQIIENTTHIIHLYIVSFQGSLGSLSPFRIAGMTRLSSPWKGDKKHTSSRAHSPSGQRNPKTRKKRNLVESFERHLVSFLIEHDLELWRPQKNEFYRRCRLHGHHLLPQVDFQPLSGPHLSQSAWISMTSMSWCFVPRCWVNALALRSIAFQLSECRPGEVRSISDLQPSPNCRKLEPSNESNTFHTIAPSHLDSLHQRRQNIHDLKHLQHGQEMPRAQNDRRMKVLHIQNVNSKTLVMSKFSIQGCIHIICMICIYIYIRIL